MLAIMGQAANNSATANQLTLSTLPKNLVVHLGGEYGYDHFSFQFGGETVTMTAAELMAALKANKE